MSLVRWREGLADPFDAFEDLQEQINRLFEGSRSPGPSGLFEQSFSPAIDVAEGPDSYEVDCDLPGLDIRDIDISVAGSVLTLKGEKRSEQRGDAARVYREEVRGGRFQRTLQLPVAVDADRIEAVLKDGVLHVTLPKREELKPRQIAVKAK
jgi:HSP20 family protein